MNLRRLASFFALLCASFSVNASNSDNWGTFSDVGAVGLVGLALAAPAYKNDWEGFRQAGYSIVTASGIGLVGKSLVNEERPDKSGNDSFPSNHSANAFAAATMLDRRYGWEYGFPAYGVATLVGVGRVKADKHYWKDVLAGAVIGVSSGWAFTEAFDDNVRVVPWAERNGAGLTASISW
jgi:membrane-associated phospholipid phosphatase